MDKIFELIESENKRQEDEICLIASENYMSKDVLKADGSILVNKYTEGYPGKRYYGGCHVIDEIEKEAIDRACRLFQCSYANVQPNSGCQANQAVYMSLLKPGDTILAMGVNEGGHISHSLGIGFAGTFYNVVEYGLDDNGYLNYDELKEKLYTNHPKLLIVGGSAYPRQIDFAKIRGILDEYNTLHENMKEEHEEVDIESRSIYTWIETIEPCLMMVDMAHIAGLIATDEHPQPFPWADVVTSTVQKTLRSGRGGLILTNDADLAKKINSAVFPRLQGGPLQNMIAGKAIGFGEALQPEFKEYIKQVLKNIKAMEKVFNERKVKLMTNGSDVHLLLLDLRKEIFSGADLEKMLEKIGIISNKNAVKGDTRSKMETSGLRIGTAAVTTRGAKETDCIWIASLISNIIEILRGNYDFDTGSLENELKFLRERVSEWCKDHPIY